MGGNKTGFPPASAGTLGDVDTSQRNALGMEQWDEAGNCYKYCSGVASLAAGDWVVVNADFSVTRSLNTPLAGPMGVAMSAFSATTKYGWVQIIGKVSVVSNGQVASAIATDAAADKKPLYLSSSAGQATTTQAAGMAMLGAWGSGAAASNVGNAWINRPFAPGFTLASA